MRIKNLPSIESMNGSQDALVIEQTDGSEDKSRKVSPAQLKQYVQTGDFEATGEIKDGHGNILKNMAKSAIIGDLSQTGLTGDSVAAQLTTAKNQIANKIKKLPTQTTRYNFTAANTYQYTGVNVTCPAGHAYIVRAFLVYSNSEPKGIAASSRSDTMRMYDCYAREELATYVTFMLVSGESAYIWGKGSTAAGDDVRLEIIDITN